MMKILAFSDIHENLSCVRKLRGQEENRYDAIVVAGDIGNDISSEFFIQISTFECPVFYVYGNWDNELEYHSQHAINCRLLHMEILEANGYFFAGYSGCPTHWGNNPIAAELRGETKVKHKAILELLEEANHRAELRVSEINCEYEFAVATIKRSAGGRGIKTKLRSLEAKWDREKKVIWRECEKIRFSRDFNRYLKDWSIAYPEIEKRNRHLLFAEIKKSAVDVGRLLLVTHERTYRIHEEMNGIKCHLFGHRHGFKHSIFQGTHCVNVSALDRVLSVFPRQSCTGTQISSNASFEDLLNVNAGTYCVIEIGEENEVKVFERKLRVDREQWILQDSDFTCAPWVPEEEKYL
jgi:hypothetical protein